jgi:stage III sporulation protein AA
VLRDGEVPHHQPVSPFRRIAREVKGAGEKLLPLLVEDGTFRSALIVSPPGIGKTTLLRDIVRSLSGGLDGVIAPLRVGLADERSEVAAMYQGLPQMDGGPRTDVLDGCPKAGR